VGSAAIWLCGLPKAKLRRNVVSDLSHAQSIKLGVGNMPPQYDNKPPATSPYEALGKRLALLEGRVAELEQKLAVYEDNAKPKTTRTATKAKTSTTGG
jgi:hypothetical protein